MILGGFIVVIGILSVMTALQFNKAKDSAAKRFAFYEKKVKTVETSYGKVTYIDEGEGEPILSCHGICGGYDQAYDTLRDKLDTYRVIAPSRFGYPGSSVPKAPSVENQVEAFTQLLEHLKIDKTYVLATSAGGAAAIKFALMHPERTKGLILYCSGYPVAQAPEKKLTYVGPPKALCNDFAMWFFSPLFGPLMGMNRSTIRVIMPLKERRQGIVLDAIHANVDMINDYKAYDLSKLEVPILMIHAKDDKMADYTRAEYWSQKVPHCTFLFFENGGHLMEGKGEMIGKALHQFVYSC